MDDNNTLERADTLSAEIDDIIMMLSMVNTISTDATDSINPIGYLDEFITGLERVATAANAAGYTEIIKTSQWCQHNLAFFKENPSQQINLFIESSECSSWLELISAYLADPEETSYASALSEELLRDDWLNAYKAEDLQALLLQLKLLTIGNGNSNDNRSDNEQSTTSSLAFTWDDDTHPEFLDAFFEETTELIGELAALLQKAAKGKLNSESRHNASRIAHTIKGGSAVAGITALSTLSYRLEKILEYSVKNELAKGIYPLLAETSHCLENLFKAIQEFTGEPKGFASVFNRLSDYAATLEEDTTPLTLGKPKLPDFITQHAFVEPTVNDDINDPADIPNDDLQNLLMQLKDQQSASNSETTAENSNKIATYQFSWDDDIHPELLSSYLGETPDQIAQVASLLLKISKNEASKSDHQQASRIAHTIKGASAVLGITALVEFTHKLEDILDHSINHTLPQDIAELLAESSDCLEDMFDAILNKEAAPDEFIPLLNRLTQYSETLEQDNIADTSLFALSTEELPAFITESASTIAEPIAEQEILSTSDASKIEVEVEAEVEIEHIKQIDTVNATVFNHHQEPDFSALMSASEVIKASIDDNTQQELSTTDSYIRVPTHIIDKLFTLVGELVTTSIQVTDKLDKSITTSKQVKAQDVRVHKMLNELSSTLLKQEKEQFKIITSLQQESGFDHLEMDTYNELHSINGLLTESILDSEAIEDKLEKQLYTLKDNLHTLDTLNKDLSEVILKSRMVSINSLIPRLERIVRQTSNKTKKKVELVVTGNEINVDTDILNGLTDPLLHLLRNAIDHGIEYPLDREARKKDKTGQITLEFSRKGSRIQMQLKDDGAGMDAEKIYQQAIKKGLISADKKLSNDEKLQLILQAGFSTQNNVTDISGRGVGMDVVNNAVRTLNGTLSIESAIGKGTTFTISIPLTLVTSTTLLVNISGHQVAIPSEAIDQLHYLTPDSVIKNERGYFVQHEDRELPIQSLATLIGFPTNTPDFSQSHTLLFIKSTNETHAIYIDEVISSRQTVIKNLSDWLDSSQGLIGACHLPDGQVAPVINLPKVLSLNEKANQLIKQIQLDSGEQTVKESVAKILVVDDSLSNRKALSLIIEQTKFDVLTAVDGLDALQIMNENKIDLVFTDLEMPRMNGVELTQAIRVWEDKKETPVVMITSRTTSKHRKLAEKAGVNDYLTKPVITETLLNSISQWLEKATA